MSQPDPFAGERQPPNPSAYAYTPAGLNRPASGLAIASFVVACVFGLLMIVSNLSAGAAIAEIEDARRTGAFSDTWAQVYDGTTLALLPGFIVVWVVTCIWLGQVRRHAQAINPEYPHARRVFWVWAGWVVPIVNLWFPFQVVRDIYAAATRFLMPSAMRWWWGLWLVMLFANRALDRLMGRQLESLRVDSEPVVVLGVIAAAATVGALATWGLTIRHVVTALDRADRAPAVGT